MPLLTTKTTVRTVRAPKGRFGRLFLALFALPFAAVGVGATYFIVHTILQWHAMQGWVEVPAQIATANVESHSGDDSSTYKAVATYSYIFEDQTYQGSRVSLSSGSDNIGSFQRRTADELMEHQRSGMPFRCYVNPANPSQAILYRSLRVEMLGFYAIFALLFGGVGFGMLTFALIGGRKAGKESKLQDQHPDEPWHWNAEWTTGVIKSSSRTIMIVSLIMAVFWNLVSTPLLFAVPGELAKGNKGILIGLIFPVVGLGLAIWAVRSVMRWVKYGESVFQMAAVPGVIGGLVGGVVRTKVKIRPDEGFRVRLSCTKSTTTGSGKNRSTSTTTLWQDERLVTRELIEQDPSHSTIPVQFAAPYDMPPVTPAGENPSITWRLEVTAQVPGVDYAASFDVPVFQTAASSPDFKLDESVMAPYGRRPDAP